MSDEARSCPQCGALNGASFDRCVRCGISLSAISSSLRASGWGRELDGRSLPATKIIAGLTLLVFAGQVMATMARGLGFPIMEGGSPVDAAHFGAIYTDPIAVAAEPWRLLSAVFVHFGAIHIALNLLALANLSRAVEPAVGSARYMIAYVTSGIVSFATSVIFGMLTHGPIVSGGASGAIFGIMGVILGVLWRRRDPRWKNFAIQAVLFSVLLGFGINASHVGVLVDNAAHVGGLVCGILFGLVYATPRRRTSDLANNVAAAVALLACVASLLLARASSLGQEGGDSSVAPEKAPSAAMAGDRN